MKLRKTYLDLMRIIAILCVIYNHTGERGYNLYVFNDSGVKHVFYVGIAAFVAVAVPIFFMISGALLLPKEESLSDLFRRRICRIITVIVLFSILQYFILMLEFGEKPSISFFVKRLFEEGIITPYWFLYAYLAYLLILPFLRIIVKGMKIQGYRYLFGLLLVVEGVMPTMLYFFGVTKVHIAFVLPMLNRVIVYPLLGYYMENYIEEDRYNNKTTVKVLLMMMLVLVFFVGMTNLRALPYESFTEYDNGLYTCSFTMILDVGIYYLAKRFYMKKRRNQRLDRVIHSMGQCVFGIYLIERPVREHLAFVCDRLAPQIGQFPACIVWVLCIYVVAYMIVLLLRQIPGVRRLL